MRKTTAVLVKKMTGIIDCLFGGCSHLYQKDPGREVENRKVKPIPGNSPVRG